MQDDVTQFFEGHYREKLEQAQKLYDERKTREALEILDKLDRTFPNRSDILQLRSLCLKDAGTAIFHEVEEEKSKKRAQDLSVRWDGEGETGESAPARLVQGRMSDGPAMGFDPLLFREPESEAQARPKRVSKDLLYIAGVFIFFGVYGFELIQIVFGGPEAGDGRKYAGMDFVWIPATTIAGAETAQESIGQGPLASTTMGGFWMGAYEISRRQWARLMAENPMEAGAQDASLPIDAVTSENVLMFVERLNRQGEGRFRLPTEEEWELACRAGTLTSYTFGNETNLLPDFAWFDENSDDAVHPVGRKRANPWGLYDTYGNVAEWCVASASLGEQEDLDWVTRGGNASDSAGACSSSGRDTPDFYEPNRLVGIRLVREPGPSSKEILRALEFPDDRSLGMVYVGMRPVGPAQGIVGVRKDERARLEVSAAGAKDLSPLTELDAGALYEISLRDAEAGDAQLLFVSQVAGLKALDLATIPVTDLGLGYIRALSLERLDLAGTFVTGAGIDTLKSMSSLRWIDLSGISDLTDTHLRSLHGLTNLRSVTLKETDVTEAGLKDLQLALPACSIVPEPPPPSPEESLRIAAVDGTYSMLLHQFRHEESSKTVGYFTEDGWSQQDQYRGETGLSPGYWVYVRPYWYVWRYTHGFNVQRDVLRTREIDWGPQHASGPIDSLGFNLERRVWAPMEPEVADQWLMVEFDRVVSPMSLTLYTAKPVTKLSKVTAFLPTGTEVDVWEGIVLLDQMDEERFNQTIRLRNELTRTIPGYRTARLKLHFSPSDTRADAVDTEPPREQIEAVQLIHTEGELWASGGVASSVYSEGAAVDMTEMALPEEVATEVHTDISTIRFRGFFDILLKLTGEETADQEERRGP